MVGKLVGNIELLSDQVIKII